MQIYNSFAYSMKMGQHLKLLQRRFGKIGDQHIYFGDFFNLFGQRHAQPFGND